jgi:hypothetical protein
MGVSFASLGPDAQSVSQCHRSRQKSAEGRPGAQVGRKAGVISADNGCSRRTLSEREVANCRSEGCHTEVAAREVERRVVRAFDVTIQPFSYCHARMSLFIGQKMKRPHVANRPRTRQKPKTDPSTAPIPKWPAKQVAKDVLSALARRPTLVSILPNVTAAACVPVALDFF